MIRDLTPEQRSRETGHYIDPGFVNRRLVETVLGKPGADLISEDLAKLPDMPIGLKEVRIDHVYTRVALAFCKVMEVPTLGAALVRKKGRLFCSTEVLASCPTIYGADRLTTDIVLEGEHDEQVLLEFSAAHVRSDTTRSELHQGGPQSLIATLERKAPGILRSRPLVIGAPWMEAEDPAWADLVVWYGHEFYEHFIEDVDEFARVRDVPTPSDFDVMASITEKAFKTCLAEILGEQARKDWGGEQSDHFTSHIHLAGRRVTAGFLLKGPARFAPMGLNHLGKNNDQIYRLAQEPAELLVVQHSHDILAPVRATLRAFAVQPSRPRRYMLIDGRDSLRLLVAYDKLARAVELSSGCGAA